MMLDIFFLSDKKTSGQTYLLCSIMQWQFEKKATARMEVLIVLCFPVLTCVYASVNICLAGVGAEQLA